MCVCACVRACVWVYVCACLFGCVCVGCTWRERKGVKRWEVERDASIYGIKQKERLNFAVPKQSPFLISICKHTSLQVSHA